MKKKEIKKNKIKPRSKAEEKRDYLQVILERMEHKSDLLSEGFLGLNKSVKDLDKKVDDLDKKVDNNHNETNSNFKTVFEYLSKIDDRIQFIESEIADLKNILKNKADLDRVIKVENEMIVVKRELVLCRRQ